MVGSFEGRGRLSGRRTTPMISCVVAALYGPRSFAPRRPDSLHLADASDESRVRSEPRRSAVRPYRSSVSRSGLSGEAEAPRPWIGTHTTVYSSVVSVAAGAHRRPICPGTRRLAGSTSTATDARPGSPGTPGRDGRRRRSGRPRRRPAGRPAPPWPTAAPSRRRCRRSPARGPRCPCLCGRCRARTACRRRPRCRPPSS